jgi:hypothetical protein
MPIKITPAPKKRVFSLSSTLFERERKKTYLSGKKVTMH